jgi:hypothetical protein
MSIGSSAVWEVRTTGSDQNAGFYIAGSGTTDYSQQDSAQATGTVTSASTTVTATTGIFTAAMVGNGITDGTTWRQITAFTSSTIVTVDSAPSWTAATINVGGALATITKLASIWTVGSNKAFVKAGSGYTQTASAVFGAAGVTPAFNVPPNHLIGYTTTRGDGGQVPIVLATSTGLNALQFTNAGWYVENFAINCASLGTSSGVKFNGGLSTAKNVKVSNFTTIAIWFSGGTFGLADKCEATLGTSAATAAIYGPNTARGNNVHDNACVGILLTANYANVVDNLVTNNTGAASDGIQTGAIGCVTIARNSVSGNGGSGLRHAGNAFLGTNIKANIFSFNGAYGCNFSAGAGAPADPTWDGNTYYSNTSGNRNNMDDTTVNAVDGVAPYTNVLDVVLTADPFVAKASNDFRLNNTAGGGAACRGHGVPTSWPGNSLTTSAPDMGAAQHADGGLIVNPGMQGAFE